MVIQIKYRIVHLALTFACLFLVTFFGDGCFRLSSKPYSVNVEKKLAKLPNHDREALDFLFRELHYASCSYVLFGDKPMSICLFLDNEPYFPCDCLHYDFLAYSMGKMWRNNLMGLKGWAVWKKHRKSFPSSNFVLLENYDRGYMTLIMINKQAFFKVVKENIDVFRKVLGIEVNPEVVLNRCTKAQDIFKDALKCDDELLGILLGYGRHNAQLFSRRHQIEGIRDSQTFSLSKKSLTPSKGYTTIEEECMDLNKKLTFFDKSSLDDFNPLLMALPSFAADLDDLETKELKDKYRKQYKYILKQYKKGDFLTVTLQQFCS